MAAKFEIERFDGKGDFSLWKQKMKALLVQLKVSKALDDQKALAKTKTEDEVPEIQEIAYSIIILYLANNVLRQVHGAKIVIQVWAKLDSIYMTKSLTNKLYIKENFFGFKMDSTKDLEQNLDEFNRVVLGFKQHWIRNVG